MFRGNKKGGVRAAATMLQRLTTTERQKLLENIAKKDPEMADLLRKNMVMFEDLKYLTPNMIGELLREINTDDFALALKTASDELKDHIFNHISKNMQEEINDVLNGKPVPLSKVEEARAQIMKIVINKVEKGELILDPDKNEEYV